MTKEELRKAAEVMIAYAEGKEIEFKERDNDNYEWEYTKSPLFDWQSYEFRVKPEPKYRPFKDADEAFAEAKKHGFWIDFNNLKRYTQITYVNNQNCNIGSTVLDYDEMLEKYTWADDGTHCGIKEE